MNGAVDVLAVLGARIARINEALANEAIAIIGSSYKQSVVARLQAELANTVATRAAAAELITELRNAHEIIKLAMNHVPADARSPWFLAIDDAGLCGDGVTRFHERKTLLDRVGGSA